MEWVETTGRTVEEALDAALDELGVDNDEVEYEVIEEARGGLRRREARIRARVKPVSREKPDDRRRRPSRQGSRSGGSGGRSGRSGGSGGRSSGRPAPRSEERTDGSGAGSGPRRRRRGGRGRGGSRSGEARTTGAEERGESTVDEDVEQVPLEEQATAAAEFTRGIVDAFGLGAKVEGKIEDDGVLVDVTGSDLGLLVGPRGVTLHAIEELVRTAVQRQTEGHGARINVDVAGYRAKRREALERFATDLAEKVKESGKEQALEPMSASDRKVVHDAIAALDGVTTASEGEEPRRRVVVRVG